MNASSRRLGELLVERKVLSRDDLAGLLARESTEGISLVKLLSREQLVSEADLVAAIAQQSGFDFVELSSHPPSPVVKGLLPGEVAWEHQAVALDLEADRLVVAMADPSDNKALTAVEAACGLPLRAVVAPRGEIAEALLAEHGPRPQAASADFSDEEVPLKPGRVPVIADFEPVAEMHLDSLLSELVAARGSDLHLSAGLPPSLRVDGHISPLEHDVMTGSEIRRMVYDVLTQKQRERFEEQLELDASHSVPTLGRFRMNVFLQKDSVGAAIRAIPSEVVPFEKLGLPGPVANFAELPRGLVLVTGPTGSGKTTTQASLIDRINKSRAVHIMTVEDPIEFLHQHRKAVVNQREVGEDTRSFSEALRHVLRQDPDVILLGEMRDLETISAALTAAETGHLVFGTLHTQDAPQSIDRVIDVFPASQQTQIRVQLAASLQGVVTQQLLPLATGRGRAVATEVLVATPAVRNLIREGKTHQIYSAMQAGGQYGMQTMDHSLSQLVKRGMVSMQSALERCSDPDDLRRLVASAA